MAERLSDKLRELSRSSPPFRWRMLDLADEYDRAHPVVVAEQSYRVVASGNGEYPFGDCGELVEGLVDYLMFDSLPSGKRYRIRVLLEEVGDE